MKISHFDSSQTWWFYIFCGLWRRQLIIHPSHLVILGCGCFVSSSSVLHGKWVNTGREDPLWSKTKRWDVINSRAHLLAVSPLTDSSDLCNRTNMSFNQTHNPRSELKQDLSLNQMIIVTSCHVWAPNSRGVTIHVKQWALSLTFSVFVICFLILVPHWTKGSH